MVILEFNSKKPNIHTTCYIASDAVLIGDIIIGKDSSVWPKAVIRGDQNKVNIGSRTNIQDNCVIHVTNNNLSFIGDNVTIGHGAIVHGCTIGNNVLIGMGAIILEGVIIEDWTIIAAGSVITEDTFVPSKSLIAGIPGKVIKKLDSKHILRIKQGCEEYVNLSRIYFNEKSKH